MRVPGVPFQARTGANTSPWQVTSAPHAWSGGRDCRVTWATPPIEGNAVCERNERIVSQTSARA